MEIEEFLTRMNIKGADNTFYKREEKDVKIINNEEESIEKRLGINVYTRFNDGSAAVVGFITYDKTFPDDIFSMNPGVLAKILSESDSIYIDGTFLVGTSKYGDIKEDIEPETWKTIKAKYENPPIVIKSEYINKLLKRSEIIDPNRITLKSDGKELIITLYSKIGSSISQVKIPCNFIIEAEPWTNPFLEVLDRVKDYDINLYVDAMNPQDRKKSPIKIEISDKTAVISYYITETHIISNKEEKPKNKKEKKEEKEVEEEDIDDDELQTKLDL